MPRARALAMLPTCHAMSRPRRRRLLAFGVARTAAYTPSPRHRLLRRRLLRLQRGGQAVELVVEGARLHDIRVHGGGARNAECQ